MLVSRYFVNERIFTLNSILYFEFGKQVFHEYHVNEAFIESALCKCQDYDRSLNVLSALMGTIDSRTSNISKRTGLSLKALETTVVELQAVGLIQFRLIHESEETEQR